MRLRSFRPGFARIQTAHGSLQCDVGGLYQNGIGNNHQYGSVEASASNSKGLPRANQMARAHLDCRARMMRVADKCV
jgi:hypothetical protein